MRFGLRLKRSLEELWLALFAWIPDGPGIALRLLAWRGMFRSCGSARFGTALTIECMGNISLGNGCRIGRGSFLTAGEGMLTLADNVAIAPNVNIGADHGEIEIGSDVAIGPGTVIRAANHRFSDPDLPIMAQGHVPGRVVIEHDVWIGANCVITPNVRICTGAVVGAGAVVTHDVPSFAIVGGVPARKIGERGPRGPGSGGEALRKEAEWR